MLLGEYECRLDQKGRIAIPARLRQEFRDGIVLTRGFDPCIVAYPLHEWENISRHFSNTPPITREKNRRFIRFVFSNAFNDKLDGQGRVLLPLLLREYAQIEDIVIITGNNKYVEIWGKGLWEKEKSLMAEQAWELAEGTELR